MKLQVLGTGCPKCQQLAKNAEQALKEMGIEGQVEKVTDINKITEMGVMVTPGFAIDGEVKAVGKVLSVEEIKGLIRGWQLRANGHRADAKAG